jgi:L-iditol 2-dehydrogenase
MIAACLHGPRDLRVEDLPEPGRPGQGEALVRVTAVGICGSDLHAYRHAQIGNTSVRSPLILGHEFSGVVEQVGEAAHDGEGNPLQEGARVAVDPARPCGKCDLCQEGDPHLCRSLHFSGLFPDQGCLCEQVIVSSRTCFPLPGEIDAATGALLEPLGVALHALGLSRMKAGDAVSVHGAGPIGLMILQLARLAGAAPVFVVEPLPWRRAHAERLGGIPIDPQKTDAVRAILKSTAGRGVDIGLEAAWGDSAARQAVDAARPGGRIILVGIPEEDRFEVQHSTARRKGLTILFSRRMKHSYPRAIRLMRDHLLDLTSLISHRFPLDKTPEAFALNSAYADEVVKVIIEVPPLPASPFPDYF